MQVEGAVAQDVAQEDGAQADGGAAADHELIGVVLTQQAKTLAALPHLEGSFIDADANVGRQRVQMRILQSAFSSLSNRPESSR